MAFAPQGFPPSISLGGAQSPGQAGGGTPGQPDNRNSEDALKRAEEAIMEFISSESDEQDKALGSKILSQIHGISATRAKETDAALGTTPAHKFVRRQTQGSQRTGTGY